MRKIEFFYKLFTNTQYYYVTHRYIATHNNIPMRNIVYRNEKSPTFKHRGLASFFIKI